jgi:hypothetical protein
MDEWIRVVVNGDNVAKGGEECETRMDNQVEGNYGLSGVQEPPLKEMF